MQEDRGAVDMASFKEVKTASLHKGSGMVSELVSFPPPFRQAPTSVGVELGKAGFLHLPEEEAQSRPVERQSVGQASQSRLRLVSHRREREQGDAVGSGAARAAHESFDTVEQEMSHPETARMERVQLPPPPGHGAAAGIGEGRSASHVPTPSRRRNVWG